MEDIEIPQLSAKWSDLALRFASYPVPGIEVNYPWNPPARRFTEQSQSTPNWSNGELEAIVDVIVHHPWLVLEKQNNKVNPLPFERLMEATGIFDNRRRSRSEVVDKANRLLANLNPNPIGRLKSTSRAALYLGVTMKMFQELYNQEVFRRMINAGVGQVSRAIKAEGDHHFDYIDAPVRVYRLVVKEESFPFRVVEHETEAQRATLKRKAEQPQQGHQLCSHCQMEINPFVEVGGRPPEPMVHREEVPLVKPPSMKEDSQQEQAPKRVRVEVAAAEQPLPPPPPPPTVELPVVNEQPEQEEEEDEEDEGVIDLNDPDWEQNIPTGPLVPKPYAGRGGSKSAGEMARKVFQVKQEANPDRVQFSDAQLSALTTVLPRSAVKDMPCTCLLPNCQGIRKLSRYWTIKGCGCTVGFCCQLELTQTFTNHTCLKNIQ